jgi:hypothetical protein
MLAFNVFPEHRRTRTSVPRVVIDRPSFDSSTMESMIFWNVVMEGGGLNERLCGNQYLESNSNHVCLINGLVDRVSE